MGLLGKGKQADQKNLSFQIQIPATYDEIVMYGNYQRLLQVMLNLVGLPGSSCADNASRIRDFGSRFTNYSEGEICSGNYADFFTQAISQIDTACQDFTPPG